MKYIYLAFILYLIAACSSPNNTPTVTKDASDKSLQTDSLTQPTINPKKAEPEPQLLKIPVIGNVDLAKMNVDSFNVYNKLDCSGTIRRYSMPRVDFAIDSMTCGAQDFAYYYYLLNPKDFLQIVYTKKSTSILNPATNTYLYSLEEQVMDFTTDSLFLMIKTDTVTDYAKREKAIDKFFTFKILKDKQRVYEQFETRYKSAWKKGSGGQ